jgi:hypothetical protein
MRIVFLDCDGVINYYETPTRIPNTGFVGVDDRFVKNLKTLIDESNKEEDTRIVLSSSWRKDLVKSQSKDQKYDESDDNALPYLKECLKKYNLELFDYTPYFGFEYLQYKGRYTSRADEILDWLDQHKDLNITNYLVLDDEYHKGFEEIDDHWIKTSFYSETGGFREEYINMSLKVLRGEPNPQKQQNYISNES